jgi:hypothetical protein
MSIGVDHDMIVIIIVITIDIITAIIDMVKLSKVRVHKALQRIHKVNQPNRLVPLGYAQPLTDYMISKGFIFNV